LKVLIITQQVIPHEGGLSTHVVDLISGLREGGHEVSLIHGGQAVRPLWERLGLMLVSLGNRDRYSARHLARALKVLGELARREIDAFRPDLIHCHDVYAASAVLRVLGTESHPIVETVHGPALYEAAQSGLDRRPRIRDAILRCEREAFAGADHFITVDSGQAEILRNDYGVQSARITVIFNSVDVDEVRRLAEPTSHLEPRHLYFLVPRRLYPKTGVRYAIEALARMPRKDVHLVVAGKGPLREELEDLARSLGVAERVHFLGSVPRSQLMPLFPRAQAVMVPSVPAAGVVEATSLAVMEAMACGTVAIASGIGGLAELIEDRQTGLLAPPGDAEALARAMMSVLEDADLHSRLVSAATEQVEKEYSRKPWLAKIKDVYQRVLSQPRPSGNAGSGR
jgi:glycosyltransferase involved in cell wall biosynthesis